MALNAAMLAQRAMRTAASVGVTSRATITRPKPAPNEITGVRSGAEVSFGVDVDLVKPAKAARVNRAFVDASIVVYAAALDCTFAPESGMTVQVGGKTYRIAVVDTDVVGGVAVGYTIGGAA